MNATQDLLSQALQATPTDHAETLFGERATGSQWGFPFTELHWQQLLPRWEPVKVPAGIAQPGCSYYEADIRDVFPGMTLGALPWRAIYGSEYEHVREAEGAHGPELQLSRASLQPRTDPVWASMGDGVATCIVGPDLGKLVIYTLHPGVPLAPYMGERDPWVAVKLIE